MRRPLTDDPLKALLVVLTPSGTWVQTLTLPIPPFPGMGIRLDAYEMVDVVSVVVGDPGCDVTCFVRMEGGATPSDEKCVTLGFESAPYP